MNFVEVEAVCEELRTMFRATTGVDIIEQVSVERPLPPQDELHFVRLVAWGYVFLIEVAGTPIKHIQSRLRGSEPAKNNVVGETIRVIRSLRTFQAHQLYGTSPRDNETRKFVQTWMTLHSDLDVWMCRSEEVCRSILRAIEIIRLKWLSLMSDDAMRETYISNLFEAIEKDWPPYIFDNMIEQAALDIGLNGLDCKSYRDIHLENWKRLAGCFSVRDEAEAALQLAIQAELRRTFGDGRQSNAIS